MRRNEQAEGLVRYLDVGLTERNAEIVRRQHLRRLDDILEALEQLNLADATVIPFVLTEALRAKGIENPQRFAPTELIERVWELQQPYLIVLPMERRRRRRRMDRVPRFSFAS